MKTESTKAINELLLTLENENDPELLKGLVKEYMGRIMRIENPVSDRIKLNIWHFVSNDELRPALCGILHENGKQIATETHILLIMESEYAADMEGKIVYKNGETFENGKDYRYPNYNAVLPKIESWTEFHLNMDSWKEIMQQYKADKKLKSEKKIVKFTANGLFFRVDQLNDFISFVKTFPDCKVYSNEKRFQIYAECGENKCLLMSVCTPNETEYYKY